MSEPTDQVKLAMARQIALALHKMMAGVPEQVMLEASIILLKSLFLATVKAEHRLSLFNAVVIKLRHEIRDHAAKKETETK